MAEAMRGIMELWHRAALALGFVSLMAAPALAQEQRNLMDFADRDDDGQVTMEEYEAFSLLGWDRAMAGRKKVKFDDLDEEIRMRYGRVPLDGEGFISKQAFIRTIPARFRLLDADEDGVLSEEEMNTYNR
jgi:hypothetical protein